MCVPYAEYWLWTRYLEKCLSDWLHILIWFYNINTSDVIDLGYSTKNKMAATAVRRLTLYPMQDIACERGSLKSACLIDFTFWYGFYTSNTLDAIHLGHSKKNKMVATAFHRLTLYPMQDIACERGNLKTAYLIDFQLILGIQWKKKWLSKLDDCHKHYTTFFSNDFITIVFNPNISRTLDKISLDLI